MLSFFASNFFLSCYFYVPKSCFQGGRVKAVIGAAGGILIPDAVTQVLINYLHRKLDPLVAVKVPRLYHMVSLRTFFRSSFGFKNLTQTQKQAQYVLLLWI